MTAKRAHQMVVRPPGGERVNHDDETKVTCPLCLVGFVTATMAARVRRLLATLGIHRANDAETKDASVVSSVCTLPPPGWRCTREPGHDGPCAALPILAPSEPAPMSVHDVHDEPVCVDCVRDESGHCAKHCAFCAVDPLRCMDHA